MRRGKRAAWKFFLIGLLVLDLIFAPVAVAGSSRLTGVARPGSLAGSLPTIASDALPTLLDEDDIGQGIGSIVTDDASNIETITQNEEKASINWATFNIGEDASVVFDQGGNSSWMVLNRIYDSNPSQIFGQLSADGKIILINQNGFYFSSSARIGNLHTLVASSLNMADNDFEADNYNFYIDDYNGWGDDNYTSVETAVIENEGEISVQSGGAIYLIAPEVYNSGSLDAYGGHAALIAGEEVELYDDDGEESTRTQKQVRVSQNPGEATNTGSITAEQGIAGMYAGVVNQEGLVTAVTAVYGNGTVELLASEKIYTSAESTTGTPLSTSGDTVDSSYETYESSVTLGGLEVGEDETDNPDYIELYGEIVSPSGSVTITAEDRIYMASGSSIDVSGAWDERSASDNQIEMTLNSVELSDDFLARIGSLLGETIYVNALVGTCIGHIDGYLDQEEVSVYGQNTEGGSITMKTTADDSDIIIDEGASISFAGGGINYSAGYVYTSKVRIGDTIYDIGSIPDDVLEMVDEIELVDDETAARYGSTYIAAYQEGDDAGSLTIVTDTLVLNGDLDGSVTKGTYQTLAEEPTVTYGEGDDAITYQTASGLHEPDAGTLIIGVSGDSKETIDRRINAVVFQADIVELDEDVEDADPDFYMLDDDTTYLSTDILNAAGLGSLKVYANTSIEIASDAELVLESSHGSGEVELVARRIDDYGSITIAGGTVAFYNDVNITSDSISMDEWIHLYDGAVIDVSGETWNNFNDPDGLPDQLHLNGGTIILQGRGKTAANSDALDDSEGVFIDEGAVVDVSGGYAVDYDGDVTGGDAGALTIEGREIVLDGDISGYSLVGYSGGTLTLKSSSLNIIHASGATESLTAESLTDWWLAQSGFAHIDFYSDGSLIVGDNVDLQPSTVKYTAPIGKLTSMTYVDASDYDADETEATSVGLTAHAETFLSDDSTIYSDAVSINSNATIEVTPGGTIALEGPYISIEGDLVARSGSVSAAASVGDITLGSGASIDVSGYTQQLTYSHATGLPLVYAVYAGGSVDLEASVGSITMADGSSIDVSGSKRVTNYYRNIYGGKESYRLAAEAGSITLTGKTFDLNGEFIAKTYLSGLTGGSLSIASTNYSEVYAITQSALESYVQSGFDALAFSSLSGLQFGDADDESDIDGDGWDLRELILDAPVISAYDEQDVCLEATYVHITNSDEKYTNLPEYDVSPSATAVEGQSNTFELAGQWLDIEGSVAIDGFTTIDLRADIDMTLSDVFYEENSSTGTGVWAGGLYTYADLKLTAGRIYPTTDTIFTISTGKVQDDGTWLGGSVEIAQSDTAALDGAILSANGQITIETNTLIHNGTLLAPMGRIILTGMGEDSQIILGQNSVLSTDSDTAVEWGYYEDGEWLRIDHTGDSLDNTVEVAGSPERYIEIVADTVTAEEGSTIDVSGGGVVYATEFEASISGSADPLTVAGRYVIIPDNSVQLPGEAIYLSGIDGIEDGYYSLLPIEYAYLDGAIILIDLGSIYSTDYDYGNTLAGYDTGIGYNAVMGTSLKSTEAHLYAVRSASDVLEEGSYNGAYSVAGDGGTLTVNSGGGQLSATYYGSGLSGYDGGQAWISSVNMELTSAEYFGSDEDVLYFDPQTLFGAGFETVIFGYDKDADAFADLIGSLADAFALLADDDDDDDDDASLSTTETLVVHDVDFSGNAIGLYASNSIDIQSNVTIGGSDDTNELILASAGGAITVADDGTTSIEADALGIYANTMEVGEVFETGEIVAIAGSGSTELVDTDYVSDSGAEEGVLRIYSGFYDQLAEADYVAIAGTSEIRTVGQVSVGSAGLLYLNTPQLTSEAYSVVVDGATVSRQSADFSAASIWIDNSGTAAVSDATETSGSMTFTASYDEAYEEDGLDTGEVQITGSVTLAAISQVDIVAQQDIVLAGEGSFSTDGDLILSAGRVTAGAVSDDEDYESADFEVTVAGLLTIQTLDGQTAGPEQTAGGSLAFTADTIVQSGTIDNFAGNISLTAESGLYLTAGSEIIASGGILDYTIADETVYQAYAAGSVTLSSGGTLEIQGATTDDEGNAIAAAIVDVGNSASDIPDDVDEDTWAGWLNDGYLDAGSLTITAEASATMIEGTLLGGADAQYEDTSGQVVEARGGDFDLTALSIDFSSLNTTLAAGGFDHGISLRAITGSIIVAADDTMQAEQIKLVADAGGIDVAGTLDASGASDDRYIELYAEDDINLYDGSQLIVAGDAGADADGGDVIVDSDKGFINMYATALIDVSASEDGDGTGGSVQFQASRYNNADADSTDDDAGANDVRVELDGTITGAETVAVVATRGYDDSDDGAYSESGDIGEEEIEKIAGDTSDYLSAYEEYVDNGGGSVEENLTLDDDTTFTLMAGVEIVYDGDLTLTEDWDFSDGDSWSDIDATGVLTIRASGDLTIAADLTDEPQTAAERLTESDSNDSWSYTLVAGADLDSADPLATKAGEGTFAVEDENLIYTESGTIRFASGGDTIIGKGQTRYYDDREDLETSYTLATYDGDITGKVKGSLTITGDKSGSNAGAIQSALGDIGIDVGGDLMLGYFAAIRTTGETTATVTLDDVLAQGSLWTKKMAQEVTFTDLEGNTVTTTYFDAIMNYHLYEQEGYENLVSYYNRIRTLAFEQFDTYANGGDITISVGGDASGTSSTYGFMRCYADDADTVNSADMVGASYVYEDSYRPAAGIVAMADGDVTVEVGGDVGSTYSTTASGVLQVGAFGGGNLTLTAGGDVDVRLYIEDGRLAVMTMQDFGQHLAADYSIEVIDSTEGADVTVNVTALGSITLGSVIDPLMAIYFDTETEQATGRNDDIYSFHWTEETALSLTSINGDITISGESYYYDSTATIVTGALPANVALIAGGDIILASDSTLWLLPSSTGGLYALAGDSIIGDREISSGGSTVRTYEELVISNLAPEQLYYQYVLSNYDEESEEYSYTGLTYGDYKSTSVIADSNGYLEAYKDAFNEWYEAQDATTQAAYQDLYQQVNGTSYNLHDGDSQPVVLIAGEDIDNLALNSPKQTQIIAGVDITDSWFRIQHPNDDDISVVAAGGEISFSLLPDYYNSTYSETAKEMIYNKSGIELAGTGDLIVAAGYDIDLGYSAGIRTVGSVPNDALSTTGADITLLAGYEYEAILQDADGNWDASVAETFFDLLLEAGINYTAIKYGEVTEDDQVEETDIGTVRAYGEAYAKLLAGYDNYDDVPQTVRDELAALYLAEIRADLIDAGLTVRSGDDRSGTTSASDANYVASMINGIDFDTAAGTGDIRMTQSQIYTQQYGDINILVAGQFDVGVSSFSDEKSDTGINTMRGGDINIYARNDLNVNESRVMTWYGGDILIWSDYGDINAGKGSKTTVSVSDPEKVYDEDTGSYVLKYTLPAVGSGIRLLTYDPDGTGPLTAPTAGNGYFFAPEGEIDAGEAGIVGQGNILLNALVLTNTQNISVGGLSSGASISQDASADVGGFSGTGGLANAVNQMDEETELLSARERFSDYVAGLSENLVPKWLSIEVVGFGDEEDEDEASEADEEGKETSDRGKIDGQTDATLEKFYNRQAGKRFAVLE